MMTRTVTTETTIPANMKEWHGGDEAPADWDKDGPVMLSGGFTFRQSDQQDPIYWGHDHDDIDSDIIAYTPKAAELLPCPWPECDGTGPSVEYDTFVHAGGHSTQARIECDCGARGPASPFYGGEQSIRADKAKAEATRLWNTRISALPVERGEDGRVTEATLAAEARYAEMYPEHAAHIEKIISMYTFDTVADRSRAHEVARAMGGHPRTASALPGDAGLRDDASLDTDEHLGWWRHTDSHFWRWLAEQRVRPSTIATLKRGLAALQTKGGDDRG